MYKLNKQDMFTLYLKGVVDGLKQGGYMSEEELFEWYKNTLGEAITIKEITK